MAKPIATTHKAGSKAARARRDQGILVTGIIVASLLFAILLLVLINQANTAKVAVNPGAYSDIPQSLTAGGAPVLGNPNAKVTMLEFADFSCPHCMEYHPTISEVIDRYVRTGKLRLVFQPETFVGGQFSSIAAQGALCAGKQGRFWEMQDALFQLQQTRGYTAFDPVTIRGIANDMGINGDDVMNCIKGGEMLQPIQNSAKLGDVLGVTGTPGVLFSTDGTNYNFLKDANGKPVIPSMGQIAQYIDGVVGAGG
jgi:protein-disulfide isomerase